MKESDYASLGPKGTPHDVSIPAVVGDKDREAVASMRGYAYQVFAASLAWLDLAEDEDLLLEVAEDFATAARDALNAVQVKDTPGTVTLVSQGVQEALTSFVSLSAANPERRVKLVFLTTGDIGQERRKEHRPGGRSGLAYWQEVATGAEVAPLRRVLETLHPTGSIQSFISARDDEALRRELVARVEWRCSQPGIEDIASELRERVATLANERFRVPLSEATRLSDNVFVEVLRATVSPDRNRRVLRRGRLDEFLNALTRISIPRAEHEELLTIKHSANRGPVRHLAEGDVDALVMKLAERVLPALGFSENRATIEAATSASGADDAAEDPALHARIDVFREMLVESDDPKSAERGLAALLDGQDLLSKPWAKFRILSNLAAVSLRLGRMNTAIERFVAAHAVRPGNSKAIANLAVARMLEGRHEEAMPLARAALAAQPRADNAVETLLHAAARCDWEGDPEDLVPADLRGTAAADYGLAEFAFRRKRAGWESLCIALAERHPATRELQTLAANAVLSLASEARVMAGGMSGLAPEAMDRAADTLKAVVKRLRRIGFEDQHDFLAHLNNACVLLRACGREAEVDELLKQERSVVVREPVLVRLWALALVSLKRKDEAVKALAGTKDPENCLLLADLLARTEPERALALAKSVDPGLLEPEAALGRYLLTTELASTLKLDDDFRSAVSSIRTIPWAGPVADAVEAKRSARSTGSVEGYDEALVKIASAIPKDAPMVVRHLLADELWSANRPLEASILLDGRLDLSRPSPGVLLYLECLASARRDSVLNDVLAGSSRPVREHEAVLWIEAVHGWNTGDLDAAETATSKLIETSPSHGRARFLRMEILLRRGRTQDLRVELAGPTENFADLDVRRQLRFATLLGHFGFEERAAAFAYRLFLENQDMPGAWMTLSSLVLLDGRGDDLTGRWRPGTVGLDAAVDVDLADGQGRFFVVEPNASLRKFDGEALEVDHPLARATWGLGPGDDFQFGALAGKVRQVRHKYVARLHDIMRRYEERFPSRSGFRSISVDFAADDGLDGLKAQLKERHDYVHAEQAEYLRGPWPLALFAQRIGVDEIDASEGIALQGLSLKVAQGSPPERATAATAIRGNEARGCVLDLLTFWTNWRLGTLDTVQRICGRIHVPRSLMDRLAARRERLAFDARSGRKTASHGPDGTILLQEVPAAAIAETLAELDCAAGWLRDHAEACAVELDDGVPGALREHVSLGTSVVFDAVLVARGRGLLLVSDDMPTRELAASLENIRACWTQTVIQMAAARGVLSREKVMEAVVHLIELGHSFISVNGQDLHHAALKDMASGDVPGRHMTAIGRAVGGPSADPVSHALVVISAIRLMAMDRNLSDTWRWAASYVLRQLIRGRHADHAEILSAVRKASRSAGPNRLAEFVDYWIVGHMIPRKGPLADRSSPQ